MDDKIKNYTAAPFDPRFPQFGCGGRCRQNFLDFHRCNSVMEAKGKDTYPCKYFQKVYRSLCPPSWLEKWNTQVEENTLADRVDVSK